MSFWQVLALILVQGLFFLAFLWTGFSFGWMSKKGTPPASIPIISNIVDSITKKKEPDEEPQGFYS